MKTRLLSMPLLAAASLNATSVLADVHYVSPTGGDVFPYTSPQNAATRIQSAIDAAEEGDQVSVSDGLYVEMVGVPAGVKLLGSGPGVCTIRHPSALRDEYAAPTVTLRDGATLEAFSILGGGDGVACHGTTIVGACQIANAWYGVSCRSGHATIRGCTIERNAAGVFLETLTSAHIEECAIKANGTGVLSYLPDAAPTLLDCRILLNGAAIAVEGPYCVVDRCLIAWNDAGAIFGMDWSCTGFVRSSTIAMNNLAIGGLSFGTMVSRSIVWGNIHELPEELGVEDVVSSIVEDERFAGGAAGTIVANPGFVGWRGFDDDNRIYVDAASPGEQDGTSERPFRSISAAFEAYDFRLGAGAPPGANGEPFFPAGCYSLEQLPWPSASPLVTLRVAGGVYADRVGVVPSGLTIKGDGHTRPIFQGYGMWSVADGARLEGIRFVGPRVTAYGAISDCIFEGPESWVSANGNAAVIGCRFLGTDHGVFAGSLGDRGIPVSNCLFFGCRVYGVRSYYSLITNCTFYGNEVAIDGISPTVQNSIIWANRTGLMLFEGSARVSYCLAQDRWPGQGNVDADPLFVDPFSLDFRLLPDSPCIDAGDNSVPGLPDTDIAGMHRIMYGGKGLTVDMGAYEYYINDLKPGPQPDEATFTWSSLPNKGYSIFYTDDLLTWHLVVESFPSGGNQTTSWIDDGTFTGVPPSLAPRRFYRVLENP